MFQFFYKSAKSDGDPWKGMSIYSLRYIKVQSINYITQSNFFKMRALRSSSSSMYGWIILAWISK